MELSQWYEIRDLFCGTNLVKQDVIRALELAACCEHPEAVWLRRAFEHVRSVADAQERVEALAAAGKPDDGGRALTFQWLLLGDMDRDPLFQGAALGYPLALAKLALCNGGRGFKLALRAAEAGEREGFDALAWYFLTGSDGCEKNLQRAVDLYSRAAALGLKTAMAQVAGLLEEADPQRFYWLGLAAAHGWRSRDFVLSFAKHVVAVQRRPSTVFAIGKALKGHIDVKKRKIFDIFENFDELVAPANDAISFYDLQIKAARLAVDAWTKVGMRKMVVKDIRIKISKLIWASKGEALFEVNGNERTAGKAAEAKPKPGRPTRQQLKQKLQTK